MFFSSKRSREKGRRPALFRLAVTAPMVILSIEDPDVMIFVVQHEHLAGPLDEIFSTLCTPTAIHVGFFLGDIRRLHLPVPSPTPSSDKNARRSRIPCTTPDESRDASI